jgi:hypothetical protein
MNYKWKPGKHAGKVPTAITPALVEFAVEIAGRDDLQFVACDTMLDLGFLHCYQTADVLQEVAGFQPVLGYSFWTTNDLFLSAEHHCISRKLNGDLVDSTGDMTGCKHILFVATETPAQLEDDHLEAIYAAGRSGGFKVLVDHPLIHRAVETLKEAAKQLHSWMMAGMAKEHYRWYDQQMDIVEELIDTYYAERSKIRKQEERQQRRKQHKAERKHKAKSR